MQVPRFALQHVHDFSSLCRANWSFIRQSCFSFAATL